MELVAITKMRMLKPEESARRAKENVEKFKREQARKALEEKRKPLDKRAPVADVPNKKLSPEEQEKLNNELIGAHGGSREEVERLLKAGADVNAKYGNGETALMWATAVGNFEVVKLLVEKGADVNAERNDGNNALKTAIGFEHKEIINFLKKHGARE